jgi:hypothetical protein
MFVGVSSTVGRSTVPYLVRSYAAPRDGVPSSPKGYCWRIVEAALATTASSPSFDPLEIHHEVSTHRFRDPSQRGFSNPTHLAIQEAQHLSSGQQPSIVLSMGAGLLNIIEKDRSPSANPAEAWLTQLWDVATDTQAVHRTVSDILEK